MPAFTKSEVIYAMKEPGLVYSCFYMLCRTVGRGVVLIARGIMAMLTLAAAACRYVADAVAELFDLIVERTLKGRGRDRGSFSVARTVSDFASSVGRSAAETARVYKKEGVISGTRKLGRDIGRFTVTAWRGLVPVLNFAVPAAAIVACVMVIDAANNFEYGIAVTFNGENIGVIEDESVYNRAVSAISARVEDATGEKYYVEGEPSFEVVKVTELDTFASKNDIEERIIAQCPDLFVESNGLYINGELVAACDDDKSVSDILDSILEDARLDYIETLEENGATDMQIDFVDQIEIHSGLYPVTSKKTLTQIKNLLTSLVSEEQVYTVQSGDSSKGIANRFGLSINELYAMNPGLEGTTIHAGDAMVVGNEVPYLQVKMSCTLTYDKETAIPVTYIESSSYYEGTTKVKSEGKPGIDRITAQVTYMDGVETGRIITDTVHVKDAVAQQVYRGTKKGYTLANLKGTYICPVNGGTLTSKYGYRTHPVTGKKSDLHTGIDIAIAKNTPIHASASGKVVFMARSGGYGNLIKVDHGGGYVTWYAHCNAFASGLKVGDKVEVGETIAYVGTTGNSTGYHCHFEIRYKEEPININGLFPNL